MERKYKKYLSVTSNAEGVCNDYLSERDLLTYIDGNLSITDTQRMERIIFKEDNEFYLDTLKDLKDRYIKYEGDIQAVCQELDDEAEQISRFQEEYGCIKESEFVQQEAILQEQFDEMNRKIEAIPSMVKKSIEEERTPCIIEPKVKPKTSEDSNNKFMEFLPLHALSKFLGKWIYRQLIL